MGAWAIETERLTKIYPSGRSWIGAAAPAASPSVDEVTLQIPRGELFGLLGPNGAGKTTLTKMLCTLISPTSGRAEVAGYSLAEGQAIRAAVGLVVTDERSFYWRLTGAQNLRFFAALHGSFGRAAGERIASLLAAVDLERAADQRFSTYSSGMKQRLAIARSLIHRPEILFLDEPTRSLDPTATGHLHELILRLKQTAGMTIFLITHDLGEAEKLCERVAVMDRGEIRVIGQPADLRRQLHRQLRYTIRLNRLSTPVRRELPELLPDLTIAEAGEDGEIELHFTASETDDTLARLLAVLQRTGDRVLSIEGRPPSLEEVFAHFTAS